MAFFQALPWHEGEDKIHKMTKVPPADNPTHGMLSQTTARRVSLSPTIALGTIDDQGRVWCTVWGGDVPIAQQVARGVLGVRTQVDASFDPVVQALYGSRDDGEVVRHSPKNAKPVSGLSIHLEERDRVKLFGHMLAGSLSVEESTKEAGSSQEPSAADPEAQTSSDLGKVGSAQLVLQITQSLGNCPKYINKKVIKSHHGSKPRLLSTSPLLSQSAIAFVHAADLFFVASCGPEDMDCNHRGGAPGFLRVVPQQSTDTCSVLVWPEYSGNNLYQTLGNIVHEPSIGLVVPNFVTGDVLYLSGNAEILLNEDATRVMPKTRLAVKFTVTAARFVANGLTFRGTPCSDNRDVSSSNPIVNHTITDGQSPYNPRVRYLVSELSTHIKSDFSSLPPNEFQDRGVVASDESGLTATLTKKIKLSPTITKYRFTLSSSGNNNKANMDGPVPIWSPGQYVALDFSSELYMGYSHMRDDEPTSLNDDFIRTFTVASKHNPRHPPPPSSSSSSPETVEFEIIVRSVGAVTRWLSYQSDRSGMTRIDVRGFAGDFHFEAPASKDTGGKETANVFIAAGIGITPLLGQVDSVTSNAVKNEVGKNYGGAGDVLSGSLFVLWTLHVRDVGLAVDVLERLPLQVTKHMRVFVTGTGKENENGDEDEDVKKLMQIEKGAGESGLSIKRRRMAKEDLVAVQELDHVEIKNWYLCTAPKMRQEVQEWLDGRTVVFENFDY